MPRHIRYLRPRVATDPPPGVQPRVVDDEPRIYDFSQRADVQQMEDQDRDTEEVPPNEPPDEPPDEPAVRGTPEMENIATHRPRREPRPPDRFGEPVNLEDLDDLREVWCE